MVAPRLWVLAVPPVIALALMLGACKREPDFDERYKKAANHISSTAKDIDTQIAGMGTPSGANTESRR